APGEAELAGELLLQRAQGALARGGRALGVDDYRLVLARQEAIAFRARGLAQQRLDEGADDLAAVAVGGEIGGDRDDQLARAPRLPVGGEERREHARQRPAAGRAQRGVRVRGEPLAL